MAISSKAIKLRYFCFRHASSFARSQLVYSKFGNPLEEVQLVESEVSYSLKPNETLIRILASPIHPADINTIQGVYAVKPALPAVGGLDCFADVLEVGNGVTGVKPGDRVLPLNRLAGSWQTHYICQEKDLYKVPDGLPGQAAVNIMTNPFTAYRMLADFVTLHRDDTVIQNLANSAVGQAVIQLSRHLGFKTVNVVRNRPSIEELKHYLKGLGADFVITEEELRTKVASDIFEGLPKPKLALNGTGGRCATDMIRWLEDGGTVVTYGGMSRQPVTASAGSLIFRDIIYRGFWCTRWMKNQSDTSAVQKMLDELIDLTFQGAFKHPPCNLVPIKDYKQALSAAMEPFINKKQILVMSDAFK